LFPVRGWPMRCTANGKAADAHCCRCSPILGTIVMPLSKWKSHFSWSLAGLSTIILSPGAKGTESGRLLGGGILSCSHGKWSSDGFYDKQDKRLFAKSVVGSAKLNRWTSLASKSQSKIDESDRSGDHLGDGLNGHQSVDMLPMICWLPIKRFHKHMGVGVSAMSSHDIMDHT
jgi:hypothetical protein